MIKSTRQQSLSLLSSLNHSKDGSCLNQKKYRCDCCKDKKYHDYNRQKRILRQSASSNRILHQSNSNSSKNFKKSLKSFSNTNLISNLQNYQVIQKQKQSCKNLSAIIQSPHLIKQELKKDNQLSKKTPKIDVKSYCKNLFSDTKKKPIKNFIEVKLNGQTYLIEFDSNQKMKLAIGELKLLIHKMQKQDNILITN